MKLRVTFKNGRHAGHVLEFNHRDHPVVSIGRSSQTHVQIYDERISRRHSEIVLSDHEARVRDLGSGNGTFINGAQIRDTPLVSGDLLQLGHTHMLIHIEPGAAAAGAPQVRPAASGELTQAWPQAPAAAAGAPTLVGDVLGVCILCQKPVSTADVQKGAFQQRGRWLCSNCVPKVEIKGYEIGPRLGEGAMGVVFMARDLAHGGRQVALKVLKTRGEFSEEDRQRFIREAATAAELEHHNIVRVLDLGFSPPHLYYAMEYLQGQSLKNLIKKHTRLPLASVIRVAVQVALALEHAREHSIVHRDIKPENILITSDGTAKLTDFGLAKNFVGSGNSNLTRPGDGLGTLPFMPPEQIDEALYADHRSDIYSFGATIYNMLTGQPPFLGKTPLEYFDKIRNEEPQPISNFRSDVPKVIEVMVLKMLRKDPKRRYQQINEVLGMLQHFLRTEFDTRQTAT
ncbi:MAG: protein kinase [Planctomycetes bacterium]|nr:protein kinase [Planctomycetota bacterium]